MRRILIVIAIIAVGLIVVCEFVSAKQIAVESFRKGEKQVTSVERDDDKLPSITYGNSRSSNKWIELKNGTRVAVDKGITYDGITYYITLTYSLVAVDDKSEKTIWSSSVSLWNKLAIEKVKLSDLEKVSHVLALRTGRDDETKAFAEFRNLKTGEKLKPFAEKLPAGSALKQPKTFSGNVANNKEKIFQTITTVGEWEKTHKQMFDGIESAPPVENVFDPEKQFLLVMSTGNATNCSGFTIASAFEDEKRFLIRIHSRTYQSEGRTPTVRPYGIFVLPKSNQKKYILERNVQNYIGGPAIWKQYKEFDLD